MLSYKRLMVIVPERHHNDNNKNAMCVGGKKSSQNRKASALAKNHQVFLLLTNCCGALWLTLATSLCFQTVGRRRQVQPFQGIRRFHETLVRRTLRSCDDETCKSFKTKKEGRSGFGDSGQYLSILLWIIYQKTKTGTKFSIFSVGTNEQMQKSCFTVE